MEDQMCPLCTEALDETDLLGQFCGCNFKICLFCQQRIVEEAAAQGIPPACPNCRSVYDKERVQKQQHDPSLLEEAKKLARREDKRKAAPGGGVKSRRDLADLRVIQRNLVYAVGLPLEICREELLKGQEYFGQFGRILKISVSRSGPYGAAGAKNGPTGSAYVTYKKPDDARKCIEAIHGADWHGKPVKATFGTTKYCNAFLKGVRCQNAECLYLHDIAEVEDSYTKEETKSAKFVQIVNAATLSKHPGTTQKESSSTSPPAHGAQDGLRERGLDDDLVVEQVEGPSEALLLEGSWPALSGKPSWAAKALGTGPSTVQPAPLLDVDRQEWPDLTTSASMPVSSAGSGLTNGHASEGARGGDNTPLQRLPSSMADIVVRQASLPKNGKPVSQANGTTSTTKLVLLTSPGASLPRAKLVSPASSVPGSTSPTESGSSSPSRRSRSPDTLPSDQAHTHENGTHHQSDPVKGSPTPALQSGVEADKGEPEVELQPKPDPPQPGKSGGEAEADASLPTSNGQVVTHHAVPVASEALDVDKGSAGAKGGPPPGFQTVPSPAEEAQLGRGKRTGPPPGFQLPLAKSGSLVEPTAADSHRAPAVLGASSTAEGSKRLADLFPQRPSGSALAELSDSEAKLVDGGGDSSWAGEPSPISVADPVVPPPARKRPPVAPLPVQNDPGAAPYHLHHQPMPPQQQQSEDVSSLLKRVLPHANVHTIPANGSGNRLAPLGFPGTVGGLNGPLGRGTGADHQANGLLGALQWQGQVSEPQLFQSALQTGGFGSSGGGQDALRKRLSGAALLQSLQQGSAKQQAQGSVEQQHAFMRNSLDGRWDPLASHLWPAGAANGIEDPAIIAGSHGQPVAAQRGPYGYFGDGMYVVNRHSQQQLPNQQAHWYLNADEGLLSSFSMYGTDQGPLQGR